MEDKPENGSEPSDHSQRTGEDSLSVWQLLMSALAAAFGVQSSRNRNRDFTKGRPGQFIAVGIIFTVIFVIAIITLVNVVLGSVAPQS